MQKLQNYAKFLTNIRSFFQQHNILEVETKSLLKVATTDSNIDSIKIKANVKFEAKTYFLHTSAEMEMKKLLAKGSGSIYQICKVYRDNEIGLKNFNEFTMLEYYILDFDDKLLIHNVLELLRFLGIKDKSVSFSYQQLFYKFANFEINQSLDELKIIAKKHKLTTDFDNLADMQDFLFVHFVEGNLKQFPICVIYDYPASQSAFAKVEANVAKRFEVYLAGTEIANGYDEITQTKEYKKRLQAQVHNNGVIDEEFLIAIKEGLPKCAGVAIGLNRLFAQLYTTS